MRNRDLLHIRHALRLQRGQDASAFFNDNDIAVGDRTISYVRIPAGDNSVGGYQITKTGAGILETTRSFHHAVEVLLNVR